MFRKITVDNFNITAIGNKMIGLFFIIATNIDILLNLESKLDKSFSGVFRTLSNI